MKMLPPRVIVKLRPRRGRPPLHEGEQSTPVSVRLSDSDYDQLCDEADRLRITVPELMRRRALEKSDRA